MARRRRVFEVFTLSFLDCICCGFGAVILFYTIVSAQAGVVHIKNIDEMTAEDKRLKAGSDERAPPGQEVSSFRKIGGERRYITGLRMRGKRILILLDVSASMLHEDLVEILRLRNTDEAHKRAAAKWRRAVETVNWLPTQGKTLGLRKYVNSAVRERLFDQAIEEIPHDVPIDCVLLPMKGDLEAAHRFWHLARMTDGTLIMPAKDWP